MTATLARSWLRARPSRRRQSVEKRQNSLTPSQRLFTTFWNFRISNSLPLRKEEAGSIASSWRLRGRATKEIEPSNSTSFTCGPTVVNHEPPRVPPVQPWETAEPRCSRDGSHARSVRASSARARVPPCPASNRVRSPAVSCRCGRLESTVPLFVSSPRVRRRRLERVSASRGTPRCDYSAAFVPRYLNVTIHPNFRISTVRFNPVLGL